MRQPQSGGAADGHEPGRFETLGKKLDDMPEVQAAEASVQHALEAVRNTRADYRVLRGKAHDQITDLSEKNLGDLVDETLAYVQKHPGRSVLAALLVGLCLGRLFRR